jgi:hypothetical protein
MTKCRPADIELDNQAPNDPESRYVNSNLLCYPREGEPWGQEFLLSWVWEKHQNGYDLTSLRTFAEELYYVGGDSTKPVLRASYSGVLSGASYNWPVSDPRGSGVCCPLPQ